MFSRVRGWVAGAAVLAVMGCASVDREPTDGASVKPSDKADTVPYSHPSAGRAPAPGRYVDSKTHASIDVVPHGDLSGWAEDDHLEALDAFLVTCDRIDALPDQSTLGGVGGAVADWRGPCEASRLVSVSQAREFFETWFTPMRIDAGDRGLVTAYFEPTLRASRTRSGAYQYPVYRTPSELERDGASYGRRMADGALSPYFSRGEIDAGALEGRGLEIAYLDDAVDNFFLHIQGSGRLTMLDGEAVRVGFAAKNGWPYRSVGQEMLRRNLAPDGDASADGIRRFYRADPVSGRALLAKNPSYIFFRELDGLDTTAGPVGAFGVQLVAGRSLAVDRRFTPFGAPVWLETDSPTGPIRKLMAAHDTGSAIVGSQRADYYWGSGDEAGRLAGRMKHPGALTVFLPNAVAQRVVGATS